MLKEQDLLNAFENIKKRYFNMAYFDKFADYLKITQDDLLESLISILDKNPNFCYIFAEDKDNLSVIIPYVANQLMLDHRLFDIINTLYIYNPTKEKFQTFFKDNHVDYPDWIDFISSDAFSGCKTLTSVTIPNSVTSIGDYAFQYSGLTSITIPDSVTSIGDCAFDECKNLTSIALSNHLTHIGEAAFSLCSNITSITIPNSVIIIEDTAFYDCSSLTSITIPDSITKIDEYTFCYCSSLTSITIPNSVTNIGEYAFRECSNLTSITLPDSITRIEDNAFHGCKNLTVYTKNPYVINYCKKNNIKYKEI